ncbi:hypothetical protein M514_02723, partial [Trichuris suis]
MRVDTGRRDGAVPFAGFSGKWAKKISDREIPEASVPAVIVVQATSIAMNVRWLYSTVKDEESAATLLREKGLLHQERLCPSCSDLMQLGRGGKVWCCYKRSCRVEVSIRTGTWFKGRRGRLKLQNAIELMFFVEEKVGIWRRPFHKAPPGHSQAIPAAVI